MIYLSLLLLGLCVCVVCLVISLSLVCLWVWLDTLCCGCGCCGDCDGCIVVCMECECVKRVRDCEDEGLDNESNADDG